jgi:hypothetical protein
MERVMTTPDYAALAAAVAADPADSDATAALLAANRGLVVTVARRIGASVMWGEEDWVEVNTIADGALWRAAQLYKPEKGAWSTYAGRAVDRALRRWWHGENHPMPTGHSKTWARTAIAEHRRQHPGASVDEICEATGLKREVVRGVIVTSGVLEFDAPSYREGETFGEIAGAPDPALAAAEERAAAADEIRRIMAAARPRLTAEEIAFMTIWSGGATVGEAYLEVWGRPARGTPRDNGKAKQNMLASRLRVAAAKLAAEAKARG